MVHPRESQLGIEPLIIELQENGAEVEPPSMVHRHLIGALVCLFLTISFCVLVGSDRDASDDLSFIHTASRKSRIYRPFLLQSRHIIGMEQYVPAVDNVLCDKYPYFEIQDVVHSNLGGKGPDSGEEGIVYFLKNLETGVFMYMHLNAKSAYDAEIPKYNGCAGLEVLTGKQCKGRFGSFNLRPGTTANFTFSFFDTETKKPVEVEHAAITWFDIDENKFHTNGEQVGMKGFAEYKLQNPTNITTMEHDDGSVTWRSSSYGEGSNNPHGPNGLTTGQKQLAVSVFYHNSHSMHATIAAGAGGVDPTTGVEIPAMPRFFTFILMPSIPCARTLLPALQWRAPEVPVDATGVFHKWTKEVGDPVSGGDVIALVLGKDGDLQEIAAPSGFSGYMAARQPFKMDDVMEHRIEAQPIAVLSFS